MLPGEGGVVRWLLFSLQVLFWVPMAFRVITRATPEVPLQRELAQSFRNPGLVLHELGLLFMWSGVAAALWRGTVDQAITVEGAIGAALHVAGIALMSWSIAVHRSWNIQARLEPGHQLCKGGPFGIVRHPIYLSFDLFTIGAAIWVFNLPAMLGALLMLISGEMRARSEERVLCDHFGEQYREYMRRVSRIIPGVY